MRTGRFGLLLGCLLLGWSGAGWAQVMPTPEQIEQFRQLPPEQQQAIASRLGVDLNQIGSIGAVNQPTVAQTPPAVVTPRPVVTMPDPVKSEASSPAVIADKAGLKRFGYDLFAGSPSTFAPVTEVPISADYVLGPGDVMQVQLYGSRNEQFQLTVNRDGRINFPGLGPVNVAGMSFEAASEVLLKKVSQQLIGVQASITMGELRSMRVFILGDAWQPGAYTISALSTMTNALLVSGGVREIGSLRNIQLKRQGRLIGTLDLYDLLLKGDTSKDLRLQPGDVIFIPPVGPTAAVSGRVRRPAIYELKVNEKVEDLVRMAGGLDAEAYSAISVLERITPQKVRTVRDINLMDAKALSTILLDGDKLDVKSLGSRSDQNVEFVGALERPGKYEWRKGARVADFIRDPRADLLEQADLNYALILREKNIFGDIDVLQFDLGRAILNKGSVDNLELDARDKVLVFERPVAVDESFGKEIGKGPEQKATAARGELLQGVLKQLRQQARAGEVVPSVYISGEVHFPGEYPLPANATAADVVLAAGGLKESAFSGTVEVTRTETHGGTEAGVVHSLLDIKDEAAVRAFRLHGRDRITIRQIPAWTEMLSVELKGEVRHPGVYPFRRGETLSQVINRAGGLTGFAYPRGAVFSRSELRIQEQAKLAEFEANLSSEIASQSLTAEGTAANKDPAKALQIMQLREKVRATKAMGRVVINLPQIISSPKNEDVVLEDGDMLVIPRKQQAVTVLGEVQHPTSYFYDRSLSMKGYLEKSGGLTARADGSRVYVIQANGAVRMPGQFLWFHGDLSQLEPGDTVVAPLNTNYLSPLSMWTQITQIIYHSAVAVAAVASL